MQTRRETLKHSLAVAGLLAAAGFPQFAHAAYNKTAFDAKSVQDAVLILVEKNPSALVAIFHGSDSLDNNFLTRAKMGQSSDVYAVAILADGKALWAKKEVKVTLGGCGG